MTARNAARGTARGRLRWLALPLAAGALALAGCGDDNSETDAATTSTAGSTTTDSTTTDTTTTGETTTSTSGGTPGYGSGYDPEEDTEENDIEPPEGSEAEEIEDRCEKNPDACA